MNVATLCRYNFEQIFKLRACLHVPSPCPCPSKSLSTFTIVSMVMDHLTGRLGSEPILSMRVNLTVAVDGDEDGDGMCKQTFKTQFKAIVKMGSCC